MSREESSKLCAEAIRTALYRAEESLPDFLSRHLESEMQEGDVVAVTSKLVSIAERRWVAKDGISKRELVQREADRYLGEGGFGVELTIKHGLLIPSAGIDESNSENGGYLLYPAHPYESAAALGRALRERMGLGRMGLILTDSHSMPLRRGVTGICLAHWGFRATRSLVGAPDLFGKPLKFTSVDVVDSLAASAVFVMGEADESCPLAILRGARLEFSEESSAAEIVLEPEDDLYGPLLRRLSTATP